MVVTNFLAVQEELPTPRFGTKNPLASDRGDWTELPDHDENKQERKMLRCPLLSAPSFIVGSTESPSTFRRNYLHHYGSRGTIW